MTKPAVTYPDPERVVRDFLATAMAAEVVTVGVGVPEGWSTSESPHLQVSLDGTPTLAHPVAMHPTVRVVAWSTSATESKRLAMLAQGHLAAHADNDFSARTLTGPLPGYDRTHKAELCSVTLRVTVRSTPIP